MARVLDRIPSRGSYPWDTWMDGSVWELTKGEDFSCQPDSLRGLVHYQAAKRGLSVSVFRIRGRRVYFQTVKAGDECP